MLGGAPYRKLSVDGNFQDSRVGTVLTLNSHFDLDPFANREDWDRRATYLRQRILCCSGLWPIPEKRPLNERIFGRIEYDGYSIEKVFFESRPGFFVTGNLYRPLTGVAPFPAVLCPHGHWPHGRLEDSEACSIPDRCSNFARQGYVTFSYDMVGYLDSFQVQHSFGSRRAPDGVTILGSELDDTLWGINATGNQLWNSIRSLDFLQGLPDVDCDRIGCTGASGGGTQTFLLTAVDDRVKAAAIVCMVSPNMQGGCICENAPNLRVGTSNIEFAAMAAPRPLIIISATNDFTREAPQFAYPAIQQVYALFSATEKVESLQFDTSHNYNRDSREAVYEWFAKWLLKVKDRQIVQEQPISRGTEWIRDSLVFYGTDFPQSDMNDRVLRDYLVSEAASAIDNLTPGDAESLEEYRHRLGPLFEQSLIVSIPPAIDISVSSEKVICSDGIDMRGMRLSRHRIGDSVSLVELVPTETVPSSNVMVVHGDGLKVLVDIESGYCSSLVKKLVTSGRRVLAVGCFATDGRGNEENLLNRELGTQFFQTYNKTIAMERIQDVLTALAYLRHVAGSDPIDLLGLKAAGIWCLMATAVDRNISNTVIDIDGFDPDSSQDWNERMFIPLIRRAGGIETAVGLVAPERLFLYNVSNDLLGDRLSKFYRASGSSEHLQIQRDSPTDEAIISWISEPI